MKIESNFDRGGSFQPKKKEAAKVLIFKKPTAASFERRYTPLPGEKERIENKAKLAGADPKKAWFDHLAKLDNANNRAQVEQTEQEGDEAIDSLEKAFQKGGL